MNIAIFLPNWIGDVTMATPALRAMRRHFHNRAQLIGIMKPHVVEVLAGTDWLDETIVFDHHSKRRLQNSVALIRQLRRLDLETIVLLTNSFRTGILARFSAARHRIGYVRYGRGWTLTERLFPPRKGRKLHPISAVDYYLQIAHHLGCPEEPRQLELATLPSDEQIADQVWHDLGLNDARQVVVLNTGSASGGARSWPATSYEQLARRIITRHIGTHVLLLCGPAEREVVAQIEQNAAHPHIHSLARHPLSIGLSKACIRRSQLMVTTDSGPRHLAAAFGIATVTLFGPTDPRWSKNYLPLAIDLQHKIPCQPCTKRECPLKHHACMRDLHVETVYRNVADLLEKTRKDDPQNVIALESS